MSANSFHHQMKKEMRSKKNDYDFDDFEKFIESKGCKLPLTKGDFYGWENGLSQEKFALSKLLLCSGQVVMFKKSETKMFWKESYLQEEFQLCTFLKKKKMKPRGITTTSKRNDIVEKLLPLMRRNRL